MSLREAREYFEREYLLAQVQKFSGNISRTANFIGMERSALHRKLRQLQVERKRQKIDSKSFNKERYAVSKIMALRAAALSFFSSNCC